MSRRRLFETLSTALPIVFEPVGQLEDARAVDAVLDLDPAKSAPEAVRAPTMVFHGTDDTPYASRVTLESSSELDPRLRGRRIWERRSPATDLPESALAGSVLARCQERPVWVARTEPKGRVDHVALAPPELGESEVLRDLLRSGRFLSLLPLVHFLRQIADDALWQPPPLRATLLIDDPSLQWPSYGYIRFDAALEHARAHRYHLAIAMVPLDAWPIHPRVARMFRDHPDLVSIAMHGNDHVRAELARGHSVEDGRRLFAQAVRRIESFERRTRIPVGRVMVAPHGVCSEESVERMLEFQLGGLCVSRPHPWLDAPRSDRPLAGWLPAELAGRGLPVIPRMHLRAGPEDLVLRAFLDQPLVLYGHHEDVGGRLEALQAAAEMLNGLGGVRWDSLARIAASNFETRREGSSLAVRLFSRRSLVDVPDGVEAIRVELPAFDGEPDGVRVHCGAASGPVTEASPGWWTSAALPVSSPGPVEVGFSATASIDPATLPPPTGRSWPVLRRAAGQFRDRSAPVLRRQGGIR